MTYRSLDLSGVAPQKSMLSRFGADERGSVAIWVGIALTVFIGCAGMAVDTARGYMLKARLSQALDAAALAGAKSLGTDNVDADITMFFNANFPAQQLDAVLDGPHVVQDATTNTVSVDAKASIDSTLMSVLGFKTITVGAAASAVRGLNGLDVVISIDMSGSMCSPCTKIEAAETAAKTLIETLYADPNPKSVIINGIDYSLLNIGMVPWSAKVNVRYNTAVNNAVYDPAAATKLMVTTDVIHPRTGIAQDHVWVTNISPVRFFDKPPTGWTGGVYARYIDDYRAATSSPPAAAVPNNESNDGDLKLGYGNFGGKDWRAFEAIPPLEGEPVSGSWPSSGEGSNWNSRSKNCYQAYWNDPPSDPTPPTSVGPAPSYWVNANPNQGDANYNDCTRLITHGILPLQGVRDATSKQLVINAIDGLYAPPSSKPEGNTNAPQGLYWAWEVLMSGEPFNEAKASVPFTRTQAIVFLTDGEITGENGDAYKGVFGPGTGAGTTNKHGKISGTENNNLNNRLKQLAANIKGLDPAKGVKIYVVQYDEPSASLKTLLQSVATEPNAPYYYQANDAAALQSAFKKIAASLSVLRLSK
ncbi:pilus assembly protein TadG-related protein [Dongia sp.]|uniref:TadE/TadG family type IV pilus assembly protein n=1 Tax=Dongia sp. TaxID=1977262 RepID=UPI0035B3F1CB